MEHQHATVEMDHTHFDDLKTQLMEKNEAPKQVEKPESTETKDRPVKKDLSTAKKYTFRKGESSFDIDDDAEIEFMADKKPMKLTLRELKDRAAGDVAVKNRMHSLAEEKKRVQASFKEFADLSKTDPLAALEYISKKAKEADGEFEYNKYLEKLAEQAENLGKMDEKERKALELEKKLKKAEQDLSLKSREAVAAQRRQEILTDYPEIGDSQFGQMVEAVLQNDELLQGVKDEKGVLDKVEELIQETLTQRDIIKVIEEINPSHASDNKLIFALSDQLRQNPDLDEEDIREIIREVIRPAKRTERVEPTRSSERDQAIRTLSKKQRESSPLEHIKAQGGTDYDILAMQLRDRQEEFKKTPKYKR